MRIGKKMLLVGLIMSIIFSAGAETSTESKIESLVGSRISLLTIKNISTAVRKCPIDENLVLAIIKVESDFKVGAVNKKSNDYGLMQINRWHIRRSRLNLKRLLTDEAYNIKQGCKILKWFLVTYPKRMEAIGRYNCGTRRRCINYWKVRRYVLRVKTWYRRLKAKEAREKRNVTERVNRTKKE